MPSSTPPSAPPSQIPDQDSQEKFPCKFNGCDKAFVRREHLVRHAQSHSEGGSRYICRICLREFTRSDSLQRHSIKHGEIPQNSSVRSKRACNACRASKIKCDGNETCARCVKKAIECVYDRATTATQDTPMADVQDLDQSMDESISNAQPSNSDYGLTNPPPSSTPTIFSQPQPQSVGESEIGDPRLNKSHWIFSGRIRKDDQASAPDTKFRIYEDATYQLRPLLAEKYKSLYFNYFHHRWPIFHRPTYEAYAPNVLISSIQMIGACFDDSEDSRDFAIMMHQKLTSQLSKQLNDVSSDDNYQQSLPVILCQAALLNIIFGLQCGREKILTKSTFLMNTLVAALREVGFFSREVPYKKPSGIPAYRIVVEGERQRMAAYLFKIDAYISLLRVNPGLIRQEELFINLPCTFASYNADGLLMCDFRLPTEPPERAELSILDFIQQVNSNPPKPIVTPVLAEDVQLGLCAMQESIWQMSEQLRYTSNPNLEAPRIPIRKKLDHWKHLLAQIPFPESNTMTPSQEQLDMMDYYYGMEDQTEPGWEIHVLSRPQNLIFDAIMLYHLLSINLHADTRTLRQLAADHSPSSHDLRQQFGAPYEQQKKDRESTAREWTHTRLAREALCHAAAILVTYSNLSGLENQTVDPIAYVALSAGALVVWIYCVFGEHDCEVCAGVSSGSPLARARNGVVRIPTAELTLWSRFVLPEVLGSSRERWVEGGGARVAIVGTRLCRCNVQQLVGRFRACLPGGWDLARFDGS